MFLQIGTRAKPSNRLKTIRHVYENLLIDIDAKVEQHFVAQTRLSTQQN